ncbi:MAG: hypothetical protein AB1600_03350 [Bacteroidota bacterium]
MKDLLKYIAYIFACATTLYIMAQIKSCSSDTDKEEFTVEIPLDSSFVPIVKQEYRPRSTPFEKGGKQPHRLPKNATESNVARTIAIVKRIPIDSAGHTIQDTTILVVLKQGDVFVERRQYHSEVRVTDFLPPIFDWNLSFSVGINFARTVSPSIAFSPLKIMGRVSFPLLSFDTEGIGIGAGWYQEDFIFGVITHSRFETEVTGLKLFIHYSI